LASKREGAGWKTAGGKRGEGSKRRGKAQCVQECDYRLFQKIVYAEVAKAQSKTV
jgi:hypothetical protein